MDRVTRFSAPRASAWLALVAAMAALAYGSNLASDEGPDEDVLFQWTTAVSSAVLYGVILSIVLAIARPIDRSVIGLRRPATWKTAAGLVAAGFVVILVAAAVLNAAGLDAGDEQGLVPKSWEAGRAAPFVANFVVIAIVAPIVEELLFRGVGFAVVRQYAGDVAAILVTAVLFGLAHGLFVALPVLALFGAVLATVRWRCGSIYPPMILHGIFNGLALVAGVTGVGT